jgi:uncharacterized LabA/DUF88 family protein
MKQKNYLFIDGTNLYAGQYNLFGPDQYLDFSKFIKSMEKKLGVRFDKIYFYASYSPQPKRPTKKEKLYLKNEALFYKSVKMAPRVVFFKGYRSPTSGKEKEVDVKLAVDVVNFAHLNKYNSLYLLSGDADFIQALLVAKKVGKRVYVLCLENKFMFRALINFPVFLLSFTGKELEIRGIKRKPQVLRIDFKEATREIR